jgi:L-alanine-DL-glutamate epimerase-like enolase superfamily enzyme
MEQPTPWNDIDALARITKFVNFSKVYADGVCGGKTDVRTLVDRDAARGE